MSDDHFNILSNVENSIRTFIRKGESEKKVLEGELRKLLDFFFAASKVDGLPRNCWDEVVAVIDQVTSEIESKSDLIMNFNKHLKDSIFHYFEKYLSNAELPQELRELADKYGFVQTQNQLNSELPIIPDHLNSLLHIEQMFDNEIGEFEVIKKKSQARKDFLLECKQQLVAVNRSELDAEIAKIDAEIRHIDDDNQQVHDQIDNLQDIIKTEMIEHSKKFISPSEMTPQVTELLKQYGINSFTLANDSVISSLKRTADEPLITVVQPKRSVDKIELLPDSDGQQDDQISGDDCAFHLRAKINDYERKMQNYEEDRLEKFRTSTINNKKDSFNSHIRVAKIQQQLEMIEYVKNNLTDDQLTKEILELLGSTTHENTNLEIRLEQLKEKLSNEYDQIILTFQSSSTSTNFNGLFETFVAPGDVDLEREEDVDQVVEGEMEDVNDNQ